MDRHTLEEIRSILWQIEELRQRLDQLLAQNELPGLTDEIREDLERIEEQATKKAAEEFLAALARVNFEDKEYKLLRVIDGDTIEVSPPEELTRWMRDVHIRLYGVDVPESNTELGPTYTAILEKLCQLNEGRLHVVWEREREGTEYAGYPTTSFERGIGNLFVDIGDGSLLYINAILASLPDVQIERRKKRLIRAARHLGERFYPLLRHWHWHFHRRFHPAWLPLYSARRTLDRLNSCDFVALREQLHQLGKYYPGSIWVLPKKIVLYHAEGPDIVHHMLREWERSSFLCPLCEEMAHQLAEHWPMFLEREDATPFDLLLLLAYAWGHEP